MSHQLQGVKVTRDDNAWEVEVKAEIPAEALAQYRETALKDIQREAKLDGFRPGKAPIERIVQVYGEATILRQAAEIAIREELPELLAAENLPVVEAPRVATETPENGKPLAFTARAPLAPRVTLPDYAATAKKHPAPAAAEVSDEEHAEAMGHLRRERHRIAKIESGTEPQQAAEESRALNPDELPALDDAFVQSLGYENAEKFSEAVRVNIRNEKDMQAREKRRAAILDALVGAADIRYPASLREYELDDMEARMEADLKQMGTTMEGYLAQSKKTRDELRAGWKDAADKRAKVRLLLAEIARKEGIEPDPAALEHELSHAKEHYPQADEGALRAHIAHAMKNDAVIRFLETGSKEPLPAHDHQY